MASYTPSDEFTDDRDHQDQLVEDTARADPESRIDEGGSDAFQDDRATPQSDVEPPDSGSQASLVEADAGGGQLDLAGDTATEGAEWQADDAGDEDGGEDPDVVPGFEPEDDADEGYYGAETRGRIKYHAEQDDLDSLLFSMDVPNHLAAELIERHDWRTAADVYDASGRPEAMDGVGPAHAEKFRAARPLIAATLDDGDDAGGGDVYDPSDDLGGASDAADLEGVESVTEQSVAEALDLDVDAEGWSSPSMDEDGTVSWRYERGEMDGGDVLVAAGPQERGPYWEVRVGYFSLLESVTVAVREDEDEAVEWARGWIENQGDPPPMDPDDVVQVYEKDQAGSGPGAPLANAEKAAKIGVDAVDEDPRDPYEGRDVLRSEEPETVEQVELGNRVELTPDVHGVLTDDDGHTYNPGDWRIVDDADDDDQDDDADASDAEDEPADPSVGQPDEPDSDQSDATHNDADAGGDVPEVPASERAGETIEFGDRNRANDYRDSHPDALHPADDDRRYKTVSLHPDASDEVVETAETEAQKSKADDTKSYGQTGLTDDERDQLENRDTWSWATNGFEAMSVKAALEAEGATDWLNYYEPGGGVGGALKLLEAGKEAEAAGRGPTGIKGDYVDSDPSDAEIGQAVEKAEGTAEAHAREACEDGEPLACDELLSEYGWSEERVERIKAAAQTVDEQAEEIYDPSVDEDEHDSGMAYEEWAAEQAPKPPDPPSDEELAEIAPLPEAEMTGQAYRALKKAWTGYKLARRDAHQAHAEADEYARVINGIRAVNDQEPLDMDSLEWSGGPVLPNDPTESYPAPDHPGGEPQESIEEAAEHGHAAGPVQRTIGDAYDPMEEF
jgi:hypothetical protein